MKSGRFDVLKNPPVNKFQNTSRGRQKFGNDELRSRRGPRRNIFPVLPRKKVYACTEADFPQLATTKTLANILDFAKIIPSDDIEDEVEETEVGDTPPGWVRIYRENGGIKLDHNAKPPTTPPPSPTTITQTDDKEEIDLAPLIEMVERWEQEKTDLNALLGDLSPYWNTELY